MRQGMGGSRMHFVCPLCSWRRWKQGGPDEAMKHMQLLHPGEVLDVTPEAGLVRYDKRLPSAFYGEAPR